VIEQFLNIARLLWDRSFVANHDGNLSLRLSEGRFLATPTAWSKRDLKEDDLIVVDLAGARLEGKHKVFSEWNLHAAALKARPAIKVVVHTHPPYASAAGLAGLSMEHLPLPEAVVSLGRVPTARFCAPGPSAAKEVARLASLADVMLLPGNGVLVLAQDLEQAFLRTELVEHVAKIMSLAAPLGNPLKLPRSLENELLQKRISAGLGPEAEENHQALRPGTVQGSGDADQVSRALRARVGVQTGNAMLVDAVVRELLK